MAERTQTFLKDHLFQIMALLFGLIGLYSMTQTLPLEHKTNINGLAITANAVAIDKKADKEVIQIQLLDIKQDISEIKNQNKEILELLIK